MRKPKVFFVTNLAWPHLSHNMDNYLSMRTKPTTYHPFSLNLAWPNSTKLNRSVPYFCAIDGPPNTHTSIIYVCIVPSTLISHPWLIIDTLIPTHHDYTSMMSFLSLLKSHIGVRLPYTLLVNHVRMVIKNY